MPRRNSHRDNGGLRRPPESRLDGAKLMASLGGRTRAVLKSGRRAKPVA